MAAQRRFVRRGISRFYYLKTVANPAAGPSRSEITAGVDVTDWVAGITGFTSATTSVAVPDMGSRLDKQIPAGRTIADSSLRCWEDLDTEEVEDTFPVGDVGFVYIMRKGDKPGSASGALFATEVSGRAPNLTVDAAGADLTVGVAVSDAWEDLVIPEAA